MAAVLWSFGIYFITESTNVLVSGFFVPAIMFFFFNIIIVYIKNDYSFIEDVNNLNRKINDHNKRVD